MEVLLTPEIQATFDEISRQSGRPASELANDAIASYCQDRLEVRQLLDSRYEDIASGRVKPISGEEAFRLLREKSEARRSKP